jgi:hypothetical protein
MKRKFSSPCREPNPRKIRFKYQHVIKSKIYFKSPVLRPFESDAEADYFIKGRKQLR